MYDDSDGKTRIKKTITELKMPNVNGWETAKSDFVAPFAQRKKSRIATAVQLEKPFNLMRYDSVLNAYITFFCSENRNFLEKRCTFADNKKNHGNDIDVYPAYRVILNAGKDPGEGLDQGTLRDSSLRSE